MEKEISDSELFYIRMPNDLEWKKSSSIVNDENLTKFQDMIMDIALILHSEFYINLHQLYRMKSLKYNRYFKVKVMKK